MKKMVETCVSWASIVVALVCASALVTVGTVGALAQTSEGRFLRIWLNSACYVRNGTGTPEAAVTGAVCDVFLRSDGGADSTLYVKESGAGNTGWVSPTSVASYSAATATETNKTFDAEGTGNLVTVPFTVALKPAACGSGTGRALWDTATESTDSPIPACVAGPPTNGPLAVLQYEDDATEYAYNMFPLPADWAGAIDMVIHWRTTATTGNVRFLFQTACVDVGETIDATWNTVQAFTDAAQGTTTRNNTVALASITTTGCAAGELLKFRLGRDPANVNDNITAVAEVYGVYLTYRRAM